MATTFGLRLHDPFTRLWLGVRPAAGLVLTDQLAGSSDLLGRLDESLRLPLPQAGWPF